MGEGADIMNTNDQYDDPFVPNDEPRDKAARVEQEIERTRRRMAGNIDSLEEKLSPEHLKAQAQEVVSEKAQEVVAEIEDRARKTGDRLVEFVADNPLPVAAATLGALWLLTKRNRSEISGDRMARFAYTGPERRAGGGRLDRVKAGAEEAGKAVRERAGELVGDAREGMRDVGDRVGEQARRARGGIARLVEEDPLIVMVGAAVLGVALGSLLPGTRREDELMGPARDALVDRAGRTARQVKASAIDAGHEVAGAVQDQLAEKGPEMKETLRDVADKVQEQVSESASRVVDESKRAASS
jgi:ElaB/YqjD/DUF883 family membrane-anchored ribosome-binding protein